MIVKIPVASAGIPVIEEPPGGAPASTRPSPSPLTVLSGGGGGGRQTTREGGQRRLHPGTYLHPHGRPTGWLDEGGRQEGRALDRSGPTELGGRYAARGSLGPEGGSCLGREACRSRVAPSIHKLSVMVALDPFLLRPAWRGHSGPRGLSGAGTSTRRVGRYCCRRHPHRSHRRPASGDRPGRADPRGRWR